jgi:hypothetical protein
VLAANTAAYAVESELHASVLLLLVQFINRAMQLTHEDMGRRMIFIEKKFTELLKRVQPPPPQ